VVAKLAANTVDQKQYLVTYKIVCLEHLTITNTLHASYRSVVCRGGTAAGQAGLGNSPSKMGQAGLKMNGPDRARPKRIGPCGQQLVTKVQIHGTLWQ